MRRALIVGGGIAGPVAAMALQRAGIESTVHEAYPTADSDIGAWLGLQTNGLDALRAIDAHRAVEDIGFPTPSISFRNGGGRRLGTLPSGMPRPGGSLGRTMKRSQLRRALHTEAVGRGVDIRYGSRLVDARTTSGGVTATFADGSSDTADLLIGADGIRSAVRSALDPGCAAARYVPVLNIGGYADLRLPGAEVGALTMIFGRRAFFGYIAAPGGQTWWFANPPMPDEPSAGDLAAITDGEWRRRLRELYSPDSSPAVDLVDATPGELRAWATYDLPTVRVWHDRRMVLIGDAAHATSPSAGQGASMAIEDAVVLARCLRDVPVAEAFGQFEAVRRPRVERVVAIGARTSSAKSPGPVARTMRDLAMPLVLRHTARRSTSQAWLHQHHIEWDAPAPVGAA